MLERAALLKEQQLAFIKTNAPTTIKCRRHPEHDRQLDEEFSAEATAAMGTLTARYLPCPNCKAEVESSRLVEYGLPANLTHANFDNFTDNFFTNGGLGVLAEGYPISPTDPYPNSTSNSVITNGIFLRNAFH